MSALSEITDRLRAMDPKEREKLKRDVMKATAGRLWFPNPGPQYMALNCEADELFYGGQAGGGKSSLGCGLAKESHERSLILRRIRDDAKKLAETELIGNILRGDRKNWNGTDLLYRHGKQWIEFGGCENEDDRQRRKGTPYDLYVFDELPDFLESQYVFIIGWNRSTTPGQRCRVVATGNPPTTSEGLWVIRRWAAWLDPTHPNPAAPGELRWYVNDENGVDTEVTGPGPYDIDGHSVMARSRTFIPAELEDNPDLAADGQYKRLLDGLPKELRDAYRDGRFDLGLKDNPWQMIPTAWVQAAQRRWTPEAPKEIPMSSLAIDVAQGGAANNVITFRHDGWFGKQAVIPGKETPVGVSQAGLVISHRKNGCTVVVDCGGGYGSQTYTDLKDENGVDNVIAYKGSAGATAKTKDGLLEYANKRTQSYYEMRLALDPSGSVHERMAIPPDPELLSDLCAVRYKVVRGVIHAEQKDITEKRVGRSLDKGDSLVMAWSAGPKLEDSGRFWRKYRNELGGGRPQVITKRTWR